MLQPGLMMDRPLLISSILEHAEAQMGASRIVSREAYGLTHRYRYRDLAARARRLANALAALGLSAGDAVATLAWNNHRHLEAYYAVSGSGQVLHTCNPRLHLDQLRYIIDHAADRVVLFDANFAPLIERIAAHCPQVRAFVCLSERAHMPAGGSVPLLCYEELLAAQDDSFAWPQFDERSAAALCYTSGTTGNPKGSLYSHRAVVLNAMTICAPASLQRITSGGSAIPTALIAKYVDDYGIEVRHGWGMTETVAVATLNALDAEQLKLPPAERHALITRQGKSVFGVEIKVVDESGETLPRDGESQGEVLIRGHWIVSGYYKSDISPLRDGWFATGDIGTIDPDGVLQIRDRAKDLIKSGGEWISSLDLENAACSHPAVATAAVIGVPHPKWQERPLMLIVRKPQCACEREDVLEHLRTRVARWWLPDEIVFVDSLPLGGTGKVQKGALRDKFGNIFQ